MLARFLGEDIENNLLANDEKLLKKIIAVTSFQNMQKNDVIFVSFSQYVLFFCNVSVKQYFKYLIKKTMQLYKNYVLFININ